MPIIDLMRLVLTPLMLCSGGVIAKPLDFSGINQSTIAIKHPGIKCKLYGETTICRLDRTSIAGLPITDSDVSYSTETGKVRTITVRIRNTFLDQVTKAMTLRYGPPLSNTTYKNNGRSGAPTMKFIRWPEFDNHGKLTLSTGEKYTSIDVLFGANFEPDKPIIDF